MDTAVKGWSAQTSANTRMTATAKPIQEALRCEVLDDFFDDGPVEHRVKCALEPIRPPFGNGILDGVRNGNVSPSGFFVKAGPGVASHCAGMDVRVIVMLTSATYRSWYRPLAPASGKPLMTSRESTGLRSAGTASALVLNGSGRTGSVFLRALASDWTVAPFAAMACALGLDQDVLAGPPVTSALRTPSSFWSGGTLSRCRSVFTH